MSAIKAMQNWWRKQRPQNNAVLCVPISQWPNDIVRMLSNRLPQLCKGLANCYIVPDTLLSNQPTEVRVATLFAFFGHPDESYQNFAVSHGVIHGQSILTPEWWSRQPFRYDIVVAHVCQGARILTRPEWQTVFPKWVSYKSDIWVFVRNDADEHLLADVAKEIVAAAIMDQKPSALKNLIRSIYYRRMAEVEDGSAPGMLQAMLFQAAVDGLVSSEES